jgi:hypothetical protein
LASFLYKALNQPLTGPRSAEPRASGKGPASVNDRLQKLAELRAKNLITEDEYQARRQEILAEI